MTIFLPLPKPKMKFRFVLVIVVATTFLFGCDREEEVKPVKVGLPSGPFAIVDISGGSEVGEYPVEGVDAREPDLQVAIGTPQS